MTAPISVVIPVLNAADRIGPCLGAVGEALFEGLIHEVVLADGGSDDDIQMVADALGAGLVTAPAGRGTQLLAGIQATTGPWVLIVHADSVMDPDWIDAAKLHMAQHPDRAGYFRLRFDSDHPMARITAGWANLRSRLFALPYGDQGLLIPRRLYDAVGGYPAIPLMEDVVIARRLGRRLLRPMRAGIVTSAERYAADGWLRRGSRNLGTLARFFMGVPPDRLARRYTR